MAPKTRELISEFNPHCTHKNVGGMGGGLIVDVVFGLIY